MILSCRGLDPGQVARRARAELRTGQDTLGGLKDTTLASGAVTFGRIVDGAGLGTFLLGRSGKETRVTFVLPEVDVLVNGGTPVETPESEAGDGDAAHAVALVGPHDVPATSVPATTQTLPVPAPALTTAPTVSVSASPNVHVNIEIHIATDATADTVREIFRNMARYVLDKHVADDGE